MKIKIIKYQTQQLFSLNTFFLAKLSQELKLYIAVSLFGPLGLFEKPKKRLFSNSKSPHFLFLGVRDAHVKPLTCLKFFMIFGIGTLITAPFFFYASYGHDSKCARFP